MDQPQRSLSSFISAQYPPSSEGSLAQSFRCKTRIIDRLASRITCPSSFLSATQEILEFASPPNSHFYLYQKQIITLVELARKTLESAGVVVYIWASCHWDLVAHKDAYINLLRMLQSNQQYVDTQFQRRLRVLLMPLTSLFSISESPDSRQLIFHVPNGPSDTSSSSSISDSFERTRYLSAPHEAASSSMPPPDDFPHLERVNNRTHSSSRRSSTRQLWHANELPPSSSARRHRSRSPHRGGRNDADADQENVAPELVPYRQPPTRQRFGIFLTGKSSMVRNHNCKDRTGRPTH